MRKLLAGSLLATVSTFLVLAMSMSIKTKEPAQIRGNTPHTDKTWSVTPLVTVGEVNGKDEKDKGGKQQNYRVPGLLDGIAAFPVLDKHGDVSDLVLLVNSEFSSAEGYPYSLANHTSLTGARVSYFQIEAKSRKVLSAGLAFDTIYDRSGALVTDAFQLNEAAGIGGFDRLCSASGAQPGKSDFVDQIFFTGEETSDNFRVDKTGFRTYASNRFPDNPAEGFGGQEAAIDVVNGDLYVVPMLGRAAFENAIGVRTGSADKVVMMIGDDSQGAPLYLYIGEKGAEPSGGYSPPDFLVRNGLGYGQLYVWVADNGQRDPDEFHGTGAGRNGRFVKVKHFDPLMAGASGWDSLGFASIAVQDAEAEAVGAFRFSRPEDLSSNPSPVGDPQVVFASTGRGSQYSSDNWGTVYLVDFAFGDRLDMDLSSINDISAQIKILYDGDDPGNQDFGIRSPDNLDWADNGHIYVNEDRSTTPSAAFGNQSGAEASVWELDPVHGFATRILEMDRWAVPMGQMDNDPSDLGNWESSGVLDVTEYLARKSEERVLILDVQAHSIDLGPDLVEGGQLLLAIKK